MDYQRFIELLERFFERAGTVLHKKDEHYPGVEGSPSFVIIDENRSTYYLTEIGLPDDHPQTDNILEQAINEYAQKESYDPFVLKMFTVLGESIKTSRFTKIDDPALDSGNLHKKSALVAADAKVEQAALLADSLGIEYQTVPLKGIFTIFFFNQKASDEIESLYNKVSGIDEEDLTEELLPEDIDTAELYEPLENHMPQEGYTEAPPEITNPFDAKTLDTMTDALDEVDREEMVQDILEDDYPEQIYDDADDYYDEPAPLRHASELARDEEQVEEAAPYYENEEPYLDETYDDVLLFEEQEKLPLKVRAANAATELYSFLLFAPAYIVNKLSKGKIPDAISYWLAAMCAFFGLYYFPLTKLFGGIIASASSIASGRVAYVANAFQQLDGTVLPQITENAMTSVNTASSWGVYLLAFDGAILQFINSEYYLKYLLAAALLLAIVPAFRIFGRRMACFLLIAYLVYIPLFVLVNKAAEMCAANLAGVENTFYNLVSVTGGVIAAAVTAPLIAILIALKMSKGITHRL